MKVPISMLLLTLGVLLGALFVSGCAIQSAPDENITRMIVQNRTLAFIDGNSKVAARVQEVAETVKSLVSDREARLDALKATAMELIPWDRLSPLEKAQLQSLLDTIQTGIEEAREQGGGGLTEAQKVRIRKVLGWIITAAKYVP